MLPKERRIPKSYFNHLIKDGQRKNSQHLLLYISKNGQDKPYKTKISFSVSKKVTNSAVVRNKLRRRGYSVVERYISNLKPNLLLFFSYKKGSEKLSFENIREEVGFLLSDLLV